MYLRILYTIMCGVTPLVRRYALINIVSMIRMKEKHSYSEDLRFFNVYNLVDDI